MCEKFCNLHSHSMFSILDGMSKPEDMINKVKRMGQKAIGVTEHGNVFSAVKMYKLAKEAGVKFIYGFEAYICDDRLAKSKDGNTRKYYHLTILAKNEQGRLNINKLVSIGYLEGFYYKPRIDKQVLEQYKEGLIILSGCMASEVQRDLAEGSIDKAKEVVRWYRQTFGDDYYLEVQSHSEPEQQKLNRQIADIAKEYNIPLVATADSHYVEQEDKELHSIFIEIGQNRDAGEIYNDTQLQSEEDAKRLLRPALTEYEIDEAIANTLVIADKCNATIPLSAPLIPHVKVPAKFSGEAEYLKYLCRQGWKKRLIHKLPKTMQAEYLERFNYEYNAICEMGFAGYYLLVYSYANTVERRGIARGSGGGSLVAYLINIVDIDPVEYGLYFERFIDVGALDLLKAGIIKPEELKIPDFDLDFGTEDREKVVKFIIDTYGKNNVASLGTFQTIWAKSAIKDVGRVLGIPFEVTNAITQELGKLKEISFSDDYTEDEGENDLEEFEQLMKDNHMVRKYVDEYPKLFKYAKQLTGIPKSFGKHPCGKVVTINEINYYTGIAETKGEQVLHMDMKDAELLGLVKIDALGLRTVDVMYDVLEMINKDYSYINPKNMNFNDPKVIEELQRGETTGMFQFESAGMRSTLKKMFGTGNVHKVIEQMTEDKLTALDILGVANALYRPGSMAYIDTYIKRKHGLEPVSYLHPDLEPILKVTYGIIVYQEQLIEIGRLAQLRNPDLLRKATGKKDAKILAKIEPELREKLYERGWTQEQFDKLWADMLAFAKYSFNKSHSYAYSIIAYITAYLKVYHPVQFICAMINSYEGKHDELQKCFAEARRLGVKFKKPSFRHTSSLCQIVDGEIMIGTSLIKFLNRQVALELDKIAANSYDSFIRILLDVEYNLVIDSRQMKILITLGYFSEFGKNKKLLAVYEGFNKRYSVKHVDKTKVKRVAELTELEQNTPNESLTIHEQVGFEREYYGFIRSVYPKISSSFVYVTDIDDKYTPKVKVYQFATGDEFVCKVKKAVFLNEFKMPLFGVGDVIAVSRHKYRNKMKKEDDKWITLEETELYIEDFSPVVIEKAVG